MHNLGTIKKKNDAQERSRKKNDAQENIEKDVEARSCEVPVLSRCAHERALGFVHQEAPGAASSNFSCKN